ncbi:D-arabinitol 4-dehydrogenase [Colwellia sp. MB02u-9]|uniref:D-arabinitol 4-dehydrogenase n=1 Tax=Colwellia sp. MB02u-9 TaxID=2759823 RepID=UPI001C7117D2|nr:D-arabinitol 4-dehydrogenase [Colwellia sp. MB02u-9]
MSNSHSYTWLHIGLGAFHRSHQAWYMHKLIEAGDNTWSITAGNMRGEDEAIAKCLREQQGEYVLETISPQGESKYEKITSIKNIVPWQEDLAPLITVGALAATKVISFTVTEAGYYLDTNNKLDQSNEAVKADLSGDTKTIYGVVASILRKRMLGNHGPVTLLNCDNLRHNGQRFYNGLVEFLQLQKDETLLTWLGDNITCPNTMVDRITPRPTEDLPQRIKEKTGIDDNAPVMAESYIQWVIEDNFITPWPNLASVGVEVVESVVPYEEAKIRILNASHSCIAWAGTLLGKSFIYESVAIDFIYNMAFDYITEDVIPSLNSNEIDLFSYRDIVLERFANINIKDTNQRVAADGFSKIPAMITPTLIDCYQNNKSPEATAMLPALFFIFLKKWHESALPYQYQDGIIDKQLVTNMYASDDPIKVYSQNSMLFGKLAEKAEFEIMLRDKINELYLKINHMG